MEPVTSAFAQRKRDPEWTSEFNCDLTVGHFKGTIHRSDLTKNLGSTKSNTFRNYYAWATEESYSRRCGKEPSVFVRPNKI